MLHPAVALQETLRLPEAEAEDGEKQREGQGEAHGQATFGRHAPPQRQEVGRLQGEVAQAAELFGGEFARGRVEHAERS